LNPDPPAIAGVDEAGRGPLAGPVVAAAVVLPKDLSGLDGLADSKRLTEKRRDGLAVRIRATCLIGVGVAEPAEIDRLNILQASLAAMRRALCALPAPADLARIDGNRLPAGLPCPAEAIVGGDASDPAIAAASIIAKTERDALMRLAAARYPGYAFEKHKGYPSPAHKAALSKFGPCPIHRRSFAPVRQAAACN